MTDETIFQRNQILMSLLFAILSIVVMSNMAFFKEQTGGVVAIIIIGLAILMIALDALAKFPITPINVAITSIEILIAISMILVVALELTPSSIFTYLAIMYGLLIFGLAAMVLMGKEVNDGVKMFYLNYFVVLVFLAIPYYLNQGFLWMMYNEILPLTAIMFFFAGTNRLKDAVKIIGGVLTWLKEG